MKNLAISFFVVMLLLASSVAFTATATDLSQSSTGEKMDVLVGFNGQPNPGLVRAFGGVIYAEFTIVDAVAAKMTEAQAQALQKNPFIRYIEPDGLVHAVGQEVPWGINRVFGTEANRMVTWDFSRGAGIGVAVLDTGIDTNHEDLKVVGGRRFYVQGFSLKQDDRYTDGNGHGTHVAGTIAAMDNGLGVVGVAPDIDLYAVKVLGDNGSGSVSAIVAGIEWTVNHPDGISIINMSLGSSTYSKTFEDACNAAYADGLLVVSSAGNTGNAEGTGDNVGYPAKYKSVVAVAASEATDVRAYFSSTGPDVELMAPGRYVYSTVPGGYDTYSGTSMASPHVAGVAAVVWAADPALTNVQVREILQSAAEDLGLHPWHQGYGMVRADLAVQGTEPPLKYPLTLSVDLADCGDVTGAGNYSEGQKVAITATARSGYQFVNWTKGDVEISDQAYFEYTMPGEGTTLVANFTETMDPPTYLLSLAAVPAGGGSAYDDTGSISYPEGAQISIRAVAASGYEFINWSAPAGTFANASNPITTFTMPAQDVTIAANFKEITVTEALHTSVATDKQEYKWNNWVYITVTVKDQNSTGVAGAAASASLEYPNGSVAARFTGTTDGNGLVVFSYRIPNKATTGDYTVVAVANMGTLTSNTATTTFNVRSK